MNILDGYVAASQVLPPAEFNHDEVLAIVFEHMAHDIVNAVSDRKRELPNEDCLFVLTCKIYKFDDYKKAHPVVFKKEELTQM